MGDALMISDLQGKVWEVNREFTALTGYPRSEVIGKTFPYPWLLESEMFRLVAWLAALREQKFLRDFDMTWKRHNGREVAISLNTTLLRNALGEPVAMLNLARDISERQRLSNELAGKSRQIEMLNRIISEANSTEKFSRIFDVIAAEVRALAAYDCMNVLLLTEDNAHLIVHAAVGEGEKYPVRGAIMPLEKTVSRLVVAERQALVVEDVRTQVGLDKEARAASDGLLSQVSVPIMLNDRAIGTLNVCSTVPDAFSVAALSYLQPIADQIGALIERTQLFEQVNDDRSHIRTLLDSMESVVYTVDQAGAVEEVNTAWREFAVVQGTPELRDETSVLGKSVEQIIADPSLRSEITAVMPRLFEGSLREFSREFEVSGKEETRSFQLAVAPMTSNDRVNGLVFTYTDITDSKRTEAEIKRRNAELLALNAVASAINKSLDMKSIFTVVRDELSWSLSFESFLYFTVDHARGDLRITEQAIGIVNHAYPISPTEQEIVAAAKGTLSSGTMADGRALIAVPVRSKGVVVAVFALAGHDPEASDHLRLLGSIGNLVEIAVDRALLYEDTVKKSEEIQERNKELDDFTYVVSHDLKEPLITIEGYSKIIQAEYRGSVDEEGQAYLMSVVQASQRMKNLIDDLLTLSRIGRVSETQESLPLREVIDEILRDFAFSLKERHATVSVPAVLPSVRYNRTQLGMVFRNLIANAIKFNTTPEPRIDISVTETGDEYTIAVRDNGIGIERQHFEKVFVIFQRLHRSDEFRGTGAGLTIVKKIVENHHGRIWLDSVVGQGTTFFFTIPVKSDG
jgi:PAS domain S-box-containing protein